MWNFLKNIFGFGKPVHEYDAHGVTSKNQNWSEYKFPDRDPLKDATISPAERNNTPPHVADIERAYGQGLTKASSTTKELPKAIKPKVNPKTGKALPVRGKGGKFQKTNG